MKRYNPSEIEPKWQKQWQDSALYEVKEDPNRPKTYVMAMFPYPSGAGLHVGHVRNYSITDTLARYNRQLGNNTLTTIGWDAFGLPAENYAIKTGIPPQESTNQNIVNFKSQLQRLGMSYDWSREINTTDPSYYKWTQWIFTKMLERGLAYQAERLQWWCPYDKTVLANEQVENGRCWRCGNEVIKKSMKQWFFKITDYADQLLDGIDDLEWPEKIKTMQRNWIGKSEGAEISFQIDGVGDSVTVFTTRPDTIFGATFLVLAPEHPLTEQLTTDEQKEEVQQYVKAAQAKSDVERQQTDREKTGVFTGAYVINPINNEKIPVWIADYVLPGYGTGAIMAVPAHDERDYEFAQKYELPIIFVVEPTYGKPEGDDTFKKAAFIVLRNPAKDKVVVLDWGPRQARHGGNMLIGGGVEGDEDFVTTATREITEETGYVNFKFVKEAEFHGHGSFYSNTKNKNMHVSGKGLLFDLIDEEKGEVNLDDGEKDKFQVTWEPIERVAGLLDDGIHEAFYRYLVLGECYSGEGLMANSGAYDGMTSSEARERIVSDLEQQGKGKSTTNYRMRDWLISRQRYWGAPIPVIHCPEHGAVPVPEKDLPVVLPVVDNYEPDGSGASVLGRVEDWVNTTCPTCDKPAKRETDTMDGYACSSWYFLRYTDAKNDQRAWDPEKANYWLPIDYYCGGDHAVSHLLYSRFWMHVFADMGLIEPLRKEPVHQLVYNGYINAADGTKMSKSKGNVVDPVELIDAGYGADALRVYELFIAPYELDAAWDPRGITGTYRFLNRVWTLTQEHLDATETTQAPLKAVHRTIKKVTSDLERLSFNTAIAAQMELVNDLYKAKTGGMAGEDWRFALVSLVQLLAPFAPHIAEELWQQLGQENSVHLANWPKWDEPLLAEDMVKIAVQVNGKLRGELEMPKDASEEAVRAAALGNEHVKGFVGEAEPKRIIYVPGRLINIVV